MDIIISISGWISLFLPVDGYNYFYQWMDIGRVERHFLGRKESEWRRLGLRNEKENAHHRAYFFLGEGEGGEESP